METMPQIRELQDPEALIVLNQGYIEQGLQEAEMYAQHPAENVGALVVANEVSTAPEAIISAEHVASAGFSLEAHDREAVMGNVNRELAERGLPQQAAAGLIVREAAQAVNPFEAKNSGYYGGEAGRVAAANQVSELISEIDTPLSGRHKWLQEAHADNRIDDETYQAGVFGEIAQATILKRGNTSMSETARAKADEIFTGLLAGDESATLLERVRTISENLKGMFYSPEEMAVARGRFDAYVAATYQRIQETLMITRIEEAKKKEKSDDPDDSDDYNLAA